MYNKEVFDWGLYLCKDIPFECIIKVDLKPIPATFVFLFSPQMHYIWQPISQIANLTNTYLNAFLKI